MKDAREDAWITHNAREEDGARVSTGSPSVTAPEPLSPSPEIPERHKVSYVDCCIPPVPAATWEWETQRFYAMCDFARQLIEELGQAESALRATQSRGNDVYGEGV